MVEAGPTMRQQLLALFALTFVSTCIGFTMKKGQIGGKYKFSPASAVVMTELFKLISSLVIIAKLLLQAVSEKTSKGERTTLRDEALTFYNENVSARVVLHLAGLAVAYSIVNLVTFGIFLAAPASTFFLMKAASPVLTAILLRFLVNRHINAVQWISVVMQCVGLVVTQYNPCTKSGTLTTLGYMLICINIVVSCGCGVWNEQIIKSYGTSVNVQNAILYTCGVMVNLLVYWTIPGTFFGLKPEDAATISFFDGYNWSVAAIIVSSGSVGLVITAVYKYADVVVKTFGLAGSTVTLYALEAAGVLPSSNASVSVMATLIGAVVVFYAAYLYIAPPRYLEALPPPTATTAEEGKARHHSHDGGSAAIVTTAKALMPIHQDSRVVAILVLGVGAIFTVLISSSACDGTFK